MNSPSTTSSNSGFPRLEFCATGSPYSGPVSVLTTPFHIGRGDTCELTIPSTHVSRVHAIITTDGTHYSIRDYKSTNGTYVNGVRIESQNLSDGDQIGIGQIELQFRLPLARFDELSKPAFILPPGSTSAPQSIITAVRRFQESISHRCVVNRFQPMIDTSASATCGYLWSGTDTALATDLTAADFRVDQYANHLLARYQRVARRVAIEEIMRSSFDHFVILPFTAEELATQCNIDDIANLCDLVPAPDQIVVQVPAAVQREVVAFPAIRDELRRYHVRLCLSEVDLEFAEMIESTAVLPDFAVLDPTAIETARADARRRASLANAIRACREKGCEFVVIQGTADDFEHDWTEMGGRFILGHAASATACTESSAAYATHC